MTWQFADPLDPALFRPLLQANLENVAANRGHPSVILWSLANESRWSPLFAEVNARVKAADATRPTSFHDQCWGGYNNADSLADVAVYHYPGEDGPARCDQEARPVLFGEYCHVQCYNRRELATDPGVRDDWGRGFGRMIDLMMAHDGCLGGAIWAGIDDVFCMPDGRTIGYGTWGAICDGWRRAKPETFHVQKGYSPVRPDVEAARVEDGRTIVPVHNRYDFTDLGEVRFTWSCGDAHGTAAIALPPHERGELVIELPPERDDDVLELVCQDPRGFVCERERIALGDVGQAPTGTSAASAAPVDAHWRVEDGRLVAGTIGEATVVTGEPTFLLHALPDEECRPVDLGVWPTRAAAARHGRRRPRRARLRRRRRHRAPRRGVPFRRRRRLLRHARPGRAAPIAKGDRLTDEFVIELIDP